MDAARDFDSCVAKVKAQKLVASSQSFTYDGAAGKLVVEVQVVGDTYEEYGEDTDKEHVDCVFLHLSCPYLCIHVSLGDIDRFQSEEWAALATIEGGNISLTQINGAILVTSDKGRVTFVLSRFGGPGGSGSITIYGTVAQFADAFNYIAQRVREIRQK